MTSHQSDSEFNLAAYFERIRLFVPTTPLPVNMDTLLMIQSAHIRAVPFENLDIVQKGTIAIEKADIENKLVTRGRGGYCFETNLLLQLALQAVGFETDRILARVRYLKDPATVSGFTHACLRVHIPGDTAQYLVDVGFGGLGPIVPLLLNTEEPQITADGTYRIALNASTSYYMLQWQHGGTWSDLYTFKNEAAYQADIDLSNWWSCTHPTARWCTCLFAARVVGSERHHLLNSEYCVRRLNGEVTRKKLASVAEVVRILETVFDLRLEHTSDAAFEENILRFMSTGTNSSSANIVL